jgi:hypothetical protein
MVPGLGDRGDRRADPAGRSDGLCHFTRAPAKTTRCGEPARGRGDPLRSRPAPLRHAAGLFGAGPWAPHTTSASGRFGGGFARAAVVAPRKSPPVVVTCKAGRSAPSPRRAPRPAPAGPPATASAGSARSPRQPTLLVQAPVSLPRPQRCGRNDGKTGGNGPRWQRASARAAGIRGAVPRPGRQCAAALWRLGCCAGCCLSHAQAARRAPCRPL